jgi:cysteine desulfurase
MGVDGDLARCALRVSLGFSTQEEEVNCFLGAWNRLVSALPKRTHGIAA